MSLTSLAVIVVVVVVVDLSGTMVERERGDGMVVDDVWAKQELELICCVRVCIHRATRE